MQTSLTPTPRILALVLLTLCACAAPDPPGAPQPPADAPTPIALPPAPSPDALRAAALDELRGKLPPEAQQALDMKDTAEQLAAILQEPCIGETPQQNRIYTIEMNSPQVQAVQGFNAQSDDVPLQKNFQTIEGIISSGNGQFSQMEARQICDELNEVIAEAQAMIDEASASLGEDAGPLGGPPGVAPGPGGPKPGMPRPPGG